RGRSAARSGLARGASGARVGVSAEPAGVRRSSASAPAQHPDRGFWHQERPLGFASLLLPPTRPAGLLPRPIGCCTPLALCAPICLLYTAYAYFIQFHPDTYTGHANVEETVTAAQLSPKIS